jgi:hypothetical protein
MRNILVRSEIGIHNSQIYKNVLLVFQGKKGYFGLLQINFLTLEDGLQKINK